MFDAEKFQGLSPAAAPYLARSRRAAQRLRGLTGLVARLERAPDSLPARDGLRAVSLLRMAVIAEELVARNLRVLREVKSQVPAEVSALMALATAVDLLEMNADLLAEIFVPLESLLGPLGRA